MHTEGSSRDNIVAHKQDLERSSEVTLSEEWIALSEASYGQEFIGELAEFAEQNNVHTILECGCGGGHILKGLGDLGFSGVGIDGEAKMVEMAERKAHSPRVAFRQLNWLDLDAIKDNFDMVMCRGNSLSSVVSWEKGRDVVIDIEKTQVLIAQSLQLMFEKIKSGGLLYLDTVSKEEIGAEGRNVEIDAPNIHLKGSREINFQARTVAAYGEGTVNGKYFKGGATSFLIYPEEIIQMLGQLSPEKIWTPQLPHEKNYQIICAKKT